MPDEVRIGERMSVITDIDSLIEAVNGDLFENKIARILKKPLPTGQLLYAMLRRAIDERIDVEVYWNHFDDLITAVLSVGDNEAAMSFHDMQMARQDKVVYIQQVVDIAKMGELRLLV